MPKVRVDGANLWYELRGEGEPPLTLIGGFALVDKQFEFCEPYLTPHHRILQWHYRGVGKSDWTQSQPYSVERWVDDLAAILDHAGIEKTALWCTSTGSSIGLRFASRCTERMDSASHDTLMREFLAIKSDVDTAEISGAGSTYCMITKPRECCEAVVAWLAGLDHQGQPTGPN